jgi:hypothetical protein
VSQPDAEQLREAIALACQPQNAWRIVQGRDRVAAMPREWVLANVETIARSVLNFGDYWEYGRYLELLDHLGAHDKVSAMVGEGLKSADADVRDMAEVWADRRPAAG